MQETADCNSECCLEAAPQECQPILCAWLSTVLTALLHAAHSCYAGLHLWVEMLPRNSYDQTRHRLPSTPCQYHTSVLRSPIHTTLKQQPWLTQSTCACPGSAQGISETAHPGNRASSTPQPKLRVYGQWRPEGACPCRQCCLALSGTLSESSTPQTLFSLDIARRPAAKQRPCPARESALGSAYATAALSAE